MDNIMLRYNEYLEYSESRLKPKTVNQYRPKVKEFIEGSLDKDLNEIFSEENLRKYIFKPGKKHSPLNWWTAIISFFNFLKDKEIIEATLQFPIEREEADQAKEAKNFESFKGGSKVSFLPKDFQLHKLLDISLYNKKFEGLTLRTILALILGTGYQFSHIENLSINEYYNDEVPNKYFDGNPMIFKRIKLDGEISEFVRKYAYERDTYYSAQKTSDKFFVKNENVEGIGNLLRNFLKNKISATFNINPHLTVEDLRYNMALHSLYKTHGSSLVDLIRIFGWKTSFLQNVLDHYYRNNSNDVAGAFDPFISDNCSDELLDSQSTTRKEILLNRVVRDTKEAVTLKEKYNCQCQICSNWHSLGYEGFYAEAHHIQQMGNPHNGPDNHSNMIILCPNHHVLFDYGIIAIDPEDGETLYHIDNKNPINGEKIRLKKHFISRQYLQYHWDFIYIGNRFSKKNRELCANFI